MKQHKDLFLANNIEALHVLAIKNDDYRRVKRFEALCSSADMLYKKTQSDPLDEEKTYIYLVRFLNLYNHMLSILNDKKFIDLRFGKEVKKTTVQLEAVKNSLIARYAAEAKERQQEKVPSPIQHEKEKMPVTDVSISILQNAEFVTCNLLYSALYNLKLNILIIDTRPEEDFKQSRMKVVNYINIPDEVIKAGLSAHLLGLSLPSESVEKWDKRDMFQAIVLMDWDTTPDTLSTSKVAKLRSILVDWDLKCHENPVILSGGFLEWLLYYPTTCTDPHVVYNRQNIDLDELLDLDNIRYPSDMDPNIYTMGKLIKPDNVTIPSEIKPTTMNDNLREEILKKEKDVTIKKQKIEKELLDAEREWIKIHEVLEQEKDKSLQEELHSKELNVETEIERLEKEQEDLNEKKSQLEQHYALYASFTPGYEDAQDEDLKEISKIEDETVESNKVLEEMANQRKLLLNDARAAKVNYQGDKRDEQQQQPIKPVAKKIGKPSVNRNTKPYSRTSLPHIEGTFKVSNGLTGLKNIKNTCYMNTVLQCLRHIPIIMEYFCSGKYASEVFRVPDVVLVETAYLVRLLWSNLQTSIRPDEFYKKICTAAPTYKLGNHEDCMEFFMFLFTQLSEDCAYDLPVNRIMSPIQKAWYDQHNGKKSFFIDTFYHQLRILQVCKKCSQKTTKFETENTFMLSVPTGDNINLDNLMRSYLSDDIIQDYFCSNCKSEVISRKDICCQPKILVIVLKRYIQEFKHGTVSVRKNEAPVNFPVYNFKVGNSLYKLNAIACHTGTMTSGHYTAVCLNPINQQWYEFNDENVRTINVNDSYVKTRACAYFYTVQR